MGINFQPLREKFQPTAERLPTRCGGPFQPAAGYFPADCGKSASRLRVCFQPVATTQCTPWNVVIAPLCLSKGCHDANRPFFQPTAEVIHAVCSFVPASCGLVIVPRWAVFPADLRGHNPVMLFVFNQLRAGQLRLGLFFSSQLRAYRTKPLPSTRHSLGYRYCTRAGYSTGVCGGYRTRV